jgi:hypothetical protein
MAPTMPHMERASLEMKLAHGSEAGKKYAIEIHHPLNANFIHTAQWNF